MHSGRPVHPHLRQAGPHLDGLLAPIFVFGFPLEQGQAWQGRQEGRRRVQHVGKSKDTASTTSTGSDGSG
eukprot:547348-Alexandrium_andersonii.AAC.1